MTVQEETKLAAATTVTVACKLPHGLILRVGQMIDRDEPVMGGGTKKVKQFQPAGAPVKINGYAAPHGKSPNCATAGGFALTPGVDAEFFAKWMGQNKSHPAVQAGLIFALVQENDAAAEAKDRRSLRNGLEPLAQKGDPRVPRRIETADEQKAA